ncbi:hypothetical protein ACU3L3_07450 [Priestia endophytica]
MGEFADDAYEAAMQEMYLFSKALDEEMEHTSNQEVVNRMITYFKENSVDVQNKLELLCKEILITAKRTKRLTPKQKSCLLKLLLQREDYSDDYYYY